MNRVLPSSPSSFPSATGEAPDPDDVGDPRRVESLIAELAARLVHLPSEQVGREITGGVRQNRSPGPIAVILVDVRAERQQPAPRRRLPRRRRQGQPHATLLAV